MKLQQLRYVWEVHRCGNHISAAAETLHTSQPGISKQIQLLESELGFAIFQRRRNRIVGVTEPGREVLAIAQRMLSDADNLKSVREDYAAREDGRLILATTHTQARYVLPHVIERFVRRWPKVRLGLRQGNPTQICELVASGEADIALGTETTREFADLVSMACFDLSRSVIAKAGHPILRAKRLTLAEIAKYPIITYDPSFSGRWKVMNAFEHAGIETHVVFGAMDADVSKTYVELGLGIAILTTVAFDPVHDIHLRARDAGHLFESSTTFVTLRPNTYLRKYMLDFIGMLAPALTPEVVRRHVRQARDGGTPSIATATERMSRARRAPSSTPPPARKRKPASA